MKFIVSLGIGALFGLAGIGIGLAQNSLEGVLGSAVMLLVLPVVGGVLYLVGAWLKSDAEEQRPATVGQRLGQMAVVSSGLFVGAIVGLFLAIALVGG